MAWVLALLVALSGALAPAHAEDDTWSASVTGRVLDPDGNPVSGEVELRRWSGTAWAWSRRTTLRDGRYTFEGVQGAEYGIKVTPAYGLGLRTLFNGGSADEPVKFLVPANAAVEGPEVVLTHRPGFRGQVTYPADLTDADGGPQVWKRDATATASEFPGWRQVGTVGRGADRSWWVDPLTTGEFRIRFVASKRVASYWYGGGAAPGDGPTVSLGEDETRYDINFVPERSGSVSGRLTWTDTRPFLSRMVEVQAHRQHAVSGVWSAVATTTGHFTHGDTVPYSFDDLPAGNYRLHFRPVGSPGGTAVLAAKFYPGVATLDEAADVVVTAGTDTPDVDLVLAFEGHSALTGTVRVPAGTSVTPLLVTVHSLDGTRVGSQRPTASVDDPTLLTWTVEHLLEGSYVVEVSDASRNLATRFNGGAAFFADAPALTLASRQTLDVAPIDLTTGLGTVSGTKRSDDGGSVGRGLIETQRWMSMPAGTPERWVAWVQISADETIPSTRLEAGEYRFSFWAWGRHRGGYYAGPGKTLATNFADAVTVTVKDGEDTRLDAVVAVGGSVRGKVTVPEGVKAESMAVGLYTQTTSGAWIRGTGMHSVAADGSYEIVGLEAGRYRVAVTPSGSSIVKAAHPQAATVAQGLDVVVARGKVTSGVDVDLTRIGQPLPAEPPAPVPVVKILKMIKAPKVTGKTKVGKTLKVSKGTWKSTDPRSKVTVKFRWQTKKGKKAVNVKKATKSKLKLTKKLKRKQVRVRVTVTSKGHPTVVRTTKWSKKVA